MVHQTIIPDDKTVTLSFTVPESFVGQEVEVVAFIRRDEQVADSHLSPALPGGALNKKAFLDWIKQAEEMPSVTLEEAKSQWEIKKQQLQQLTR